MADPTPLILSRTESETPSGIRRVEGDEKYIPPSSPSSSSSSSSTLDETIEQCLGDFGWAQFFQAALVSVAWVFDAQQTFVSVFTDAQPTWHLTTTTGGGDTMMMICQLPRNSWAWDMPIDTSIISEWSLECAGSIMTGLPASSFFMGCLAGGFILATLADSSSLGRKNMLLLSCLLMSLAGLSTVFFSTNIWIYSALRFVSGFGRSTIGTCALVLSTELVGKRWRPQVGIIGFICFTLGFLSLPAIAYFNRGSSWRLLYLWTCVPAIFYCVLFHFLALESPRWLFLRGRKQEFLATLKTLATPAKRSSMTTSIDDDDDDIEQVQVVEEESALSMVRQALVLGGVFSPVLVAAGRNNSGLLSYGVFGVTIGLCGLFVTFLPETRGHTICDTMDEEEPQT